MIHIQVHIFNVTKGLCKYAWGIRWCERNHAPCVRQGVLVRLGIMYTRNFTWGTSILSYKDSMKTTSCVNTLFSGIKSHHLEADFANLEHLYQAILVTTDRENLWSDIILIRSLMLRWKRLNNRNIVESVELRSKGFQFLNLRAKCGGRAVK